MLADVPKGTKPSKIRAAARTREDPVVHNPGQFAEPAAPIDECTDTIALPQNWVWGEGR